LTDHPPLQSAGDVAPLALVVKPVGQVVHLIEASGPPAEYVPAEHW
jgi:hypothetical protein